MKKKLPNQLLAIAKRVVWFKKPEETLKDPIYFLCYLMQYGLTKDVITAKKNFTKADFKNALINAYPGILDKRSWAYWNLILFQNPNHRPIPKRKL